jgi:hypothetical protein
VFRTLDDALAVLNAEKVTKPKLARAARDLPRGVFIDKRGNIKARIQVDGVTHTSPTFDSEEQASRWYELFKDSRAAMKAAASIKRLSGEPTK